MSTLPAEVPTRSPYTPAEIERGLVALALVNGNVRRASKDLEAQGLHVPPSTLEGWRKGHHADQYAQVREEILPALKAELADQHSAVAAQQVEVSAALTTRLANEIDELPTKDLPGAARNMSVASAVHTDKARDLRGEPSVVHEHRSAKEIMQGLAQRFPGVVRVVKAEDVEVHDAQGDGASASLAEVVPAVLNSDVAGRTNAHDPSA